MSQRIFCINLQDTLCFILLNFRFMKESNMPRTKVKTEAVEINKALNPYDTPSAFRLGELGYIANNNFSGIPQDELKSALNFPASLATFKEMSYHSAVASSIKLFELIASKSTWKIKPPVNATKSEKKKAEMIEGWLKNMKDQSFNDFLTEVCSAYTYGFSIFEKVYIPQEDSPRKIAGIKRLGFRNQRSITKFHFSEDGNDVIGVRQNITALQDNFRRFTNKGNVVDLPRSKFLLFRVGQHCGSPVGKSPLIDAYVSWKFLTEIEKIEAQGLSKDLQGIPLLTMPAQYMSSEATPAQKSIYQYYMQMLNNLQQGSQSGIILPSATDPETRQPLFSLDLLESVGKKSFDTTTIKKYYRDAIHIALFADLLILGTSNTGSYNLASAKQTLIGAFVEQFLTSVADEINKQLIQQIYEINEWDTTRMPRLDFDSVSDQSLEEISKYVSRIGAVGYLTKDLDVINAVRTPLGLDPMTESDDWEALLPEKTSRSGDGYKTAGEGTSTSVAGGDSSAMNMENKS